jgi:hypothetical protein
MAGRSYVGGHLLLCAVVLLLLAPTGAGAKPGYSIIHPTHVAYLTLKGSHGYEITFYKRNRESLEVVAENLGASVFDPWVFAEYRIHQHWVKGNEIAGRFPGLGRVSVRFHPVGHRQRESGFAPPGCSGGGVVKQPGYFEGTIRFRGEQGYTVARATRAHGELSTREKEVCKRSPKHPPEHRLPKGLITARLRATSKSGGRLIRFSVDTFEPLLPTSNGANIHASIDERRNGMEIRRYVLASGRKDALQLGDSSDFPASATVSPSDPFHGSAVFERVPQGENAWTGSLSVPLPGAGLVPLTGRGFSASLCHEGGCSRY